MINLLAWIFLPFYLDYLNYVRKVPVGFTLNRRTGRIELRKEI